MGGSVCLPGGRWGRWAWCARSERVPSEPPQFSGRKPCGGPSTVGRVTVTTGPESCPALRHRLTPHRPKGGDGQRPSARGWVHKRVRPQRGVSRSRDKQRRLPLPRRGWKLGTRGLVGGRTWPRHRAQLLCGCWFAQSRRWSASARARCPRAPAGNTCFFCSGTQCHSWLGRVLSQPRRWRHVSRALVPCVALPSPPDLAVWGGGHVRARWN